MPATRTSQYHASASLSPYRSPSPFVHRHNIQLQSNPLSIYEYARLTKDYGNFRKFANAVEDVPEVNCDIYFLDHINQTIRKIEKSLCNQRLAADQVFERLLDRGFEQKTIHIIRELRPQPLTSLGSSIDNPIIIDDEDDSTPVPRRSVKNRTSTPGLRRSKRTTRSGQNLKGR
ncbi:hypothetical protein M413DRAFT_30857 [Hebeloma cylindrosporum]|uniref:Uncharacterized protein n=1 Tax=Hebeloma cylindrosporum TaxID=76867 RepID=A0A0C2XHN9_HEBCY|nr:hypothetical protein M413DRAFT_30857 [Hebeloma cylindrosporum h7]